MRYTVKVRVSILVDTWFIEIAAHRILFLCIDISPVDLTFQENLSEKEFVKVLRSKTAPGTKLARHLVEAYQTRKFRRLVIQG